MTDIYYVPGLENSPANALSRLAVVQTSGSLDYKELAKAQVTNIEFADLLESTSIGLVLKRVTIPGTSVEVYCDTSTDQVRPYLTLEFRKIAFNVVHSLAHPGVQTTAKMVANHFVWPKMKSQVIK